MSWVAVDPATYWSAYQCFQIRDAQVERDLKLLTKGLTSVNDTVDKLNSNAIDAPLGYCIVFSEAYQAHYVVYRGDSKVAAYEKFGKSEAGLPARLVAAKAVAKGKFALLPHAVLLYRFMEFNAQVTLLTLLTWFINPAIIAALFVLFWFLPAVWHSRSFLKPIGYPLLNFVVDDFSFLSLHPKPRSAWKMYTLAIVRVLLEVALVFLLRAPLPEDVIHFLAHNSVFQHIFSLHVHGLGTYVALCWGALFAVVALSTVIWICITLHMFLIHKCGGRPSPILGVRDDGMLAKVDELADKVEVASKMEPAQCRQELLRLKQENPAIQVATFPSVFGPAWAMLLHIGIDAFNVYNFITTKDFIRAVMLTLTILFTVLYAANQTRRGMRSMYHECKLSWDRGMFTDDYLKFIRADKGIQSIPALIIIISGLPFKAKGVKSTVGGLGSIAINLALVVPFITQQFDLGIDHQGDDIPQRSDSVRSTEVRDVSGDGTNRGATTPMLDA